MSIGGQEWMIPKCRKTWRPVRPSTATCLGQKVACHPTDQATCNLESRQDAVSRYKDRVEVQVEDFRVQWWATVCNSLHVILFWFLEGACHFEKVSNRNRTGKTHFPLLLRVTGDPCCFLILPGQLWRIFVWCTASTLQPPGTTLCQELLLHLKALRKKAHCYQLPVQIGSTSTWPINEPRMWSE